MSHSAVSERAVVCVVDADASMRRSQILLNFAGAWTAIAGALICCLTCTLLVALSAWPVWTLEPLVMFDLDWAVGLAYAAEHRLHFGDGIAFTFGPLGFLHSPPIGPMLLYDRITLLQLLCTAVLQLSSSGPSSVASTSVFGVALRSPPRTFGSGSFDTMPAIARACTFRSADEVCSRWVS